jgi:hypothetical protein
MDGCPLEVEPMADFRWIISVHKFYEHETIESMETELARLKALFPEKEFRVYQITTVQVSDSTPEPVQSKRAAAAVRSGVFRQKKGQPNKR